MEHEDLMRDVYMTREQREAYEQICKNAKRYLWLRNGNAYVPEEQGVTGGDDLDALIDGMPADYGWAKD
jgi:hypothetical protein